MPSLNKVYLLGNLTRDPEVRQLPGGQTVVTMGLAMNRSFANARGETREEVCFVDVETWGRQAEVASTYLRKGSPVFIEGRLRFDQWDDRETGKKRSRLSVTTERLQLMGAPGQGANYAEDGSQQNTPFQPPAAPAPYGAPAPARAPANAWQQQPPASMPAFEPLPEDPGTTMPF
ncbi:single-stranded DNA-binding protein [Oligosphaera ethanolica]|jgi:single-strand DNA-binding protein|uniref:Single-stranded DNA-binding protein n=1 Tax=Oligosphaera ethanolica TaxID=760260 RepID=A0AAE3VH82_9BACT|nr:single-stranded DNA-binding protein [Oligosphaera ethanolica]MDQ0290390.1 single-strand DNA-binding protein [Oligosphaera ethanolica]NLE54279.1 single-stranded DNA-binding protein [Lentisphaerota bacterium]